MDDFIKGIFAGGLVICILMLNFDKPQKCQISLTKGNITTVQIGDYDE